MINLFVTDTVSLVSYFSKEFKDTQKLSKKARTIIDNALSIYPLRVKLSIPSVVFVEIYDKWFRNEETAKRLRYEVFDVITKSPNIEIKPIEEEVLENVLKIGDELDRHDMHDKIILASAIMLNCPIITVDTKIIGYLKKHPIIPYIS